MAEAVTPFKVQIPDSELELLRKKLELARLPDYEGCEWGEEAEGGVTSGLMRETVDHWRTKYDWRAAEARMNEMPQYKTSIPIDGFDAVNVHFVHAKPADPAAAAGPPPTPLLFLHGWPGSFIEVQEMLPRLLAAGFHVVAPSLAGFGFSGYPRQAGFQLTHQAEMMNRLMARLGYGSYLVQGGDWGSLLGRIMAVRYPKHVKALHLNMIFSSGPNGQKWPPADEELTPREQRCVDRAKFFQTKNSAYQALQATKPRTVGYAFHDSPLGMLAWMADKVLIWSDPKAKAWTPDELITWTLLRMWKTGTRSRTTTGGQLLTFEREGDRLLPRPNDRHGHVPGERLRVGPRAPVLGGARLQGAARAQPVPRGDGLLAAARARGRLQESGMDAGARRGRALCGEREARGAGDRYDRLLWILPEVGR
ncbi:hypothetical protein RB601_000575 [Gaeumannomyces tritici]